MRQPRIYVIVGALGLAALAVGLFGCGRAGAGHGQVIAVTPVSTTITVDPGINETFAPPPADAAPAMTAEQAWTKMDNRSIGPGTTVQLGLLTVPVGPDCGAECENNNIVQGGMVYSALNQLAYGYSWSTCPAGSTLPAIQCTDWIFLDANTGQMIIGQIGQTQGWSPAGQTASPSAG